MNKSRTTKPNAQYYVPTEDLLLEEVMDEVLVRYGKDPATIKRMLKFLLKHASTQTLTHWCNLVEGFSHRAYH